jgi:hypothetical protein
VAVTLQKHTQQVLTVDSGLFNALYI